MAATDYPAIDFQDIPTPGFGGVSSSTYSAYTTDPNFDYAPFLADTAPAPVSSGGSWLQGLNSLLSPLNSLTQSAATIIKATNQPSQPTAGYYDAAGTYHRTTSTGVAATSTGTPTIPAGQFGNFSSGVSGAVNSVMSAITPLLPWVIGGVVLFFFVKLLRKR